MLCTDSTSVSRRIEYFNCRLVASSMEPAVVGMLSFLTSATGSCFSGLDLYTAVSIYSVVPISILSRNFKGTFAVSGLDFDFWLLAGTKADNRNTRVEAVRSL